MAADEVRVSSDQMNSLSAELDAQFDRACELSMPENPGRDVWGFEFLSEAFSAFQDDGLARGGEASRWCADTADGVRSTSLDASRTEEEIASWFRIDRWNRYGNLE